jgi:hypothetical protein
MRSFPLPATIRNTPRAGWALGDAAAPLRRWQRLQWQTSIAQARATGDSSRLAVGLATHGWLAFRCGDLGTAEGDARTALAAIKLPAPPMYRVMNGGLLVKTLVERGELDAAEEALAPLDANAESGSVIAAEVRFARGRLRIAQGRFAEGLEDFLAVGTLLTRATITCPGYLPWRSEAALAQLAFGDHESARLAHRRLSARSRLPVWPSGRTFILGERAFLTSY